MKLHIEVCFFCYSVFHQSSHLFSLLIQPKTLCFIVNWHSCIVKIILLLEVYVLNIKPTDFVTIQSGNHAEAVSHTVGERDYIIKVIHLWYIVQNQTQKRPINRESGLYSDYLGNHPIPAQIWNWWFNRFFTFVITLIYSLSTKNMYETLLIQLNWKQFYSVIYWQSYLIFVLFLYCHDNILLACHIKRQAKSQLWCFPLYF